ncbi:LOW QUALITY PROTEIN: MRPL37 isoform 6, partial [Pongo abelii]
SLLLQVRGSGGARLSTKDPLPTIASREEVEATKNHVLETFYPISPIIDLHECNIYDVKNDTGFQEGYPYPYPHTLYLLDKANLRPHRLQPDQLRAKMILFAFGSALAQARLLYGNDAKVLEQPVVVQSVGTDGRVFHFLVFQLNTTDLDSNEGVKNLAWVDSDQLLYQHFWCLPVIKKRVVVTGPCFSKSQMTSFVPTPSFNAGEEVMQRNLRASASLPPSTGSPASELVKEQEHAAGRVLRWVMLDSETPREELPAAVFWK